MPDSQNHNELTTSEKAMEDLHHFLDVPMKITVQLANRDMKVRDILQLQPNSIVDLPKSAGENVDILINERLIAYGEVMELEGSTGIRLTDLHTQS
jgi:flagellar motor switch protein FliN/FliY